MVQNYERGAVHGQPAAFHGWKHDSTLGDEYEDVERRSVDPKTKAVAPGPKRRDGGFVKRCPEVVTVPNSVEYRRALSDLSLWPADQATAQEAGVPFDPCFGGEEELAKHAAPAPRKSLSPAPVAEKA